MILGVVGQLTRYFMNVSDPRKTSTAVDSQLELIQDLKEQLELPESERKYPGNTDQLRAAIARFEEMASGSQKRRQEAEAALDYLETRVTETFTDEFWPSLIEITPDDLPEM